MRNEGPRVTRLVVATALFALVGVLTTATVFKFKFYGENFLQCLQVLCFQCLQCVGGLSITATLESMYILGSFCNIVIHFNLFVVWFKSKAEACKSLA